MTAETNFYTHQPLAVFGVSAKGQGFGAAAYKELTKLGIKAYALNPKGGFAQGQPIYLSLKDLPEPARSAVILTKGEGARQAVEECSRQAIEWVWLQGGSDTPELRRLCSDLKLRYLAGTCILMRKGHFPHSLHRFFHDLFSGKSQSRKS